MEQLGKTTTVRHGIAPDCPEDQDPWCICGGQMEWVECFELGCEDGWINRYEDDPLWFDEDDWERCPMCDGKGGWWQCVRTMSE